MISYTEIFSHELLYALGGQQTVQTFQSEISY